MSLAILVMENVKYGFPNKKLIMRLIDQTKKLPRKEKINKTIIANPDVIKNLRSLKIVMCLPLFKDI